jgi:hypothetical protein
MSDVERLVYDLLKYDYVETIYKYRILSNKRAGRIYNYYEYLTHAQPGNYDAILVFKTQDGYQIISTNITVYNRGTARYFSFTPHNDKRLVLVLLKSTDKKT